ncbi:MAG: FG-GAP repeat domain-containing protein, partial [Planctomycetia bacterium]
LLGNGNGTFKPKTDFASGGTGSSLRSVTLGDVNGDGRLDIITVNAIANANNAGVLLNTTTAGATTASFGSPTSFATGTNPYSVTLGDVNGDGRLDIVTANQNSSNSSVLLGNGNGTFQNQATLTAGTSPSSVTLGDLNSDGRLDIVTANRSSNNASVLLGTGGSAITATFSPQQTFAAGNGPVSVNHGDVNGDGILDIITANYYSNNASVLLGNGNGTFKAETTFATGIKPASVTLGDVNGDGRLDIII